VIERYLPQGGGAAVAILFHDGAMEVAAAVLVKPEEIERYDVVPHDEEYALLRGAIA
jgi:hypothetical protein